MFTDILVNNVPFSKESPEAKLKRIRLIALTKELSEMPFIDLVLWVNLMKRILSCIGSIERQIQNVSLEY